MTAGTLAVMFDPTKDKSYAATRLGRDVADFLAWLELGGASPRTLDQYERDLSRGALMFPDRAIDELADGDVLHIAMSFPPASRRNRMAAWRSFYKWGLRTRRVTVNPCDALPDLRQKKQAVIDVFNDAEIASFLALPVRDAAPAGLLLEAGLRKAEARHLVMRDCLPESGQVIVRHGKGGKQRIVPMSDALAHVLNELALLERLNPQDHVFYAIKRNQIEGFEKIVRDKPVGEGTFHRWWERCCRTAGVRYRNAHVARHTYATRWINRGLDLVDVQKALGHASITTTASVYVHTQMEDVAARMRAIEAREAAEV